MSEATNRRTPHDDEAATVEGRLADIISAEDCEVRVDGYRISESDKRRVIRALRLAATLAELAGQKS